MGGVVPKCGKHFYVRKGFSMGAHVVRLEQNYRYNPAYSSRKRRAWIAGKTRGVWQDVVDRNPVKGKKFV